MRVHTTTATGSSGTNEDLVEVGDHWAVVLDGASAYAGVDVRCVHTVAWVTARLGGHLAVRLGGTHDLRTCLRHAITATTADHGPQCDTGHPLALGATVAIARWTAEALEWLVLGDAAVAVERVDGRVTVTTDDRVERLPDPPMTDEPVRTYAPAYVARWRNQPGGFWVASTTPEAADQALTGSLSMEVVQRVLLVSDGISRLTDRYGMPWRDLLTLAAGKGLPAVVDAVRTAELADPDPRRWRGKRHDDASAALIERGEVVRDSARRVGAASNIS